MMWIALLAGAQAQESVAITEFLNESIGPEPAAEWVELFNYGASDVDLTGYTLRDEDTDFSVVPAGTIIPAGGYLILANDPAQFVLDWGVGTVGVDVIQITTTLANTSDEINLFDNTGQLPWGLAYVDDETLGFSTHLTDDTFSNATHGSKANPGVVRAGDDNGIAGYLGYEDGAATADPFAFVALNGDSGSPLDGPYTGATPVAPLLVVSGACPGIVNLDGVGYTPFGQVAILTSPTTGTSTVPAGPCVGTELDLAVPTFRGTQQANIIGLVSTSPNVPAPACGLFAQFLDLTTCEVSNTAALP